MKEGKKPHKSSIGNVDANIMAIITYIGGSVIAFIPGLYYFSWAVPLVIYIIEKKSDFVRKNAIQSLSLQIISSLIMFVLYVIIGGIIRNSYSGNPWSYVSGIYSGIALVGTIATIISLIFAVVAIIAIINAYNYREYSIPFIGKTNSFIEKTLNMLVNKINPADEKKKDKEV